jgi:hypothetical protein
LAKLNCREPDRDVAAEALRTLSAAIDEIVALVRNTWIQIKGAGKEAGMFDFDFDDTELQHLYQSAIPLVDAASFVKVVIDRLWERTERDLENVRAAIQNELNHLLCTALESCYASLAARLSSDALAQLRDCITAVRTQLDYGLGAIADWFHVDDPERMSAFPVVSLIDALIETVKRCSGPSKLSITQRIFGRAMLPGRLFRALWDLMFLLLDNIAKHAAIELVDVTLSLDATDDGIRITVENALGAGVECDSLSAKVAPFQNRARVETDAGMLRREGGSGFFKLHKIVRYDFGCTDYDVTLGVSDGRRFCATIDMRLPGGGNASTAG